MAEIAYQNFDLLIEREQQGYRARANSPEGEAANDFSLPFSEQELASFLERVSQPWQSTRAIDSPELDSIKDFGGRLFSAVFDKPVYVLQQQPCDRFEAADSSATVSSVRGHNDYARAACPGKNLSPEIPKLRESLARTADAR